MQLLLLAGAADLINCFIKIVKEFNAMPLTRTGDHALVPVFW
ncbi:hypothetical protein [Vulcanisaeta souniana]|nr:hypothetical protein [Vulcanisaeta souniana]